MNLTKGESFDLTKAAPGLTKVFAGAGWNVSTSGPSLDVDLVAFLLDENGKLQEDKNFVYFNNKCSACSSVCTRGDNLTGVGDGDDEVINVDLEAVPATIKKIVLAITIYQAATRGQSLKSLEKAFVRIVDSTNNNELSKYELDSFENAGANFILGELVRNDSGWSFTAVGEPRTGELAELVNSYK